MSKKFWSFCIRLHCRILVILHIAFTGDALKPGEIFMIFFLHQGKLISEKQIIILVIENKNLHVLQSRIE